MIKILFLAAFVGTIGYLPVYVLDTQVMPQLESLKNTYQSYGDTADNIASGKDTPFPAKVQTHQ